MISETLVNQHKYTRTRLLGTLAEIEKSAHADEGLHWMMPFGKNGRAHISWQMMHIAATLDRYLNVRIKGGQPADAKLVEQFAGGSSASPENRSSPDAIRGALEKTAAPYFEYFMNLAPGELDKKPGAADRSNLDIQMLLNFHEAHHQGQCHIIWNSFKALKEG